MKVPKALSRLAVKAAKQKRCEHQIDKGRGFVDGALRFDIVPDAPRRRLLEPGPSQSREHWLIRQHYCADRAKNPRYVYVRRYAWHI